MIDCALIQYLRYEKQFYCISMEFPYAYYYGKCTIADLAVYHNNYFYEFEIKKSWSDFKNDFKKEVWTKDRIMLKHDYIKEGLGPHKFWFCFPAKDEKLIKKATEFLKENYPKYGILAVSDSWAGSVRASRVLHSNKLSEEMKVRLECAPYSDVATLAGRILKYNEYEDFKKLKRDIMREYGKEIQECSRVLSSSNHNSREYNNARDKYLKRQAVTEFLSSMSYRIRDIKENK